MVAGAVHHPSAVQLVFRLERFLGTDVDETPLRNLGGNHLHGFGVQVAKLQARLGNFKDRVGCLENRFVNLALHNRELAVHREGSRDVGCVEAVNLDARVKQNELARLDRAVIHDPVQNAGVRTGSGDGLVTEFVALGSCLAEERAFDDSFAALVGEGLG